MDGTNQKEDSKKSRKKRDKKKTDSTIPDSAEKDKMDLVLSKGEDLDAVPKDVSAAKSKDEPRKPSEDPTYTDEEKERLLKFLQMFNRKKSTPTQSKILKKPKKDKKKRSKAKLTSANAPNEKEEKEFQPISKYHAVPDSDLKIEEEETTSQNSKVAEQVEQSESQKSMETNPSYGDKPRSKPKQDKKSKSMDPKGKHGDKPKSKRKQDHMRSNIFGYRSKLNPYPNDSETHLGETSSGADAEHDMTWLFSLSSAEEKEPRRYSKPRDEDSVARSTLLLWFFLWVGGRLPFHFETTGDGLNPRIICRVQKNSCYFFIFVITSLFLMFITAVSIVNFALIVFIEDVKGNQENQIEKQLLEDHMARVIIFLAFLTSASISSVVVLINGDLIAQYITLWENTLDNFKLKSIIGIKAATRIYIVWSISLFLIQLIFFYFTNSDPNPNPFIEGTNALIAIVFRSFVLVDPATKTNIQSSAQWGLGHYGALIVCLNAYAMYCSWNFVIMIVVISIGITNIAREWNFRLGITLRKINIKRNEVVLQSVRLSHGYRSMFKWHRKIMALVQENSKVFSTILVAFYLAVAFSLTVELHELALFVGDVYDNFEFKSDENDQDQLHGLNENSNRFFYLCFYLSQTIGIFLFVSLFIAQAGIKVMSALSHITRHNYMSLTSSRQRNFLMSLQMSFSARKPNLMKVGRIFIVDRPFIFSFLAFFMCLFTVMIQVQHPRILSIPTIIKCPPNSDSCCIVLKQTTKSEVGTINDMNEALAIACQDTQNKPGDSGRDILSTTMTTSTPSPTPPPATTKTTSNALTTTTSTIPTTTTPRPPRKDPDDCGNLPKNNSPMLLISSQIHLNTHVFVLCCYNYGDGKVTNCNKMGLLDLQSCNVSSDESARRTRPYRFDDLDSNIQSCLIGNNTGHPMCGIMNECICGDIPTVIVPTPVELSSITCLF